VRRAEAERQKELTLKQALGEERYEQFRLNQDPNYRSARSLAGELGAQPQTIQPLYEVGTAFKAELNRIKLNPELTPAQRAAEIEAAQQAQREAMKNLLDPDAYERFIERGLRGR
jgi:hypothetical protein